jgi:hypothetical protein
MMTLYKLLLIIWYDRYVFVLADNSSIVFFVVVIIITTNTTNTNTNIITKHLRAKV